jgi:hypothetical protein
MTINEAAKKLKDHFGYPSPPWLHSVGPGQSDGQNVIVITIKKGFSPVDVPNLPESWAGFKVRCWQ